MDVIVYGLDDQGFIPKLPVELSEISCPSGTENKIAGTCVECKWAWYFIYIVPDVFKTH
jgi:hypothetical protein